MEYSSPHFEYGPDCRVVWVPPLKHVWQGALAGVVHGQLCLGPLEGELASPEVAQDGRGVCGRAGSTSQHAGWLEVTYIAKVSILRTSKHLLHCQVWR